MVTKKMIKSIYLLLIILILIGRNSFAIEKISAKKIQIRNESTQIKTNDQSGELTKIIQPYIVIGSTRTNLRICETDGGTPELAEEFIYQKPQLKTPKIVILCKWDDKHLGVGINASRYQIFVYELHNNKLIERRDIEEKFGINGEGDDGLFFNKPSVFKYRNKADIVKKLNTLKKIDVL
jgi:hypothetical protein